MLTGAAAVQQWFSEHPEIPVEPAGDGAWLAVLPGERKRAIPVHLDLRERGLLLQSFFMRAPDENAEQAYALLLRRHLRSHIFRFALAEDGDLLIVGLLPAQAVTVPQLDVALGQLLLVADDAFDPALRRGFESYIAREQAWREKVGAARNPIT